MCLYYSYSFKFVSRENTFYLCYNEEIGGKLLVHCFSTRGDRIPYCMCSFLSFDLDFLVGFEGGSDWTDFPVSDI